MTQHAAAPDSAPILGRLALAVAGVLAIGLLGWLGNASYRLATEETREAQTGAPGRFVTIDGHAYHVQVIGDLTSAATPILLVHDFDLAGGITWMPWAAHLTATHPVIIPDLLGFGHSDRAPSDLKERAATLSAMLDALDVRSVDVVGLGYGGVIAAALARNEPAKVRRLVLMDAATRAPPHTRLMQLPLTGRAATWDFGASGPRSAAARACRTAGDCRALRLAQIAGTTDALQAMSREVPAEASFAGIQCPSLVIWGAGDPVAPVSVGDRLAQELHARIAVISNAGHAPYLDQPDRLADRITDFFNTAD